MEQKIIKNSKTVFFSQEPISFYESKMQIIKGQQNKATQKLRNWSELLAENKTAPSTNITLNLLLSERFTSAI